MDQQSLLYDERFLESYAGAIITDPATAIVELVANCWDAYATEVEITWPDKKTEKQFKIKDNGEPLKSRFFGGSHLVILANPFCHSELDPISL